ncbi:hypothetical protein D3C78_1269930 [compost metagenome]
MTSLSSDTVKRIETLTSVTRTSVFIVDDSMFERNRSKAVELFARFKDHATGAFYKGFRMLTLGWSDGHTFLPLDLALLSSVKAGLTGMNQESRSAPLGTDAGRKPYFLPYIWFPNCWDGPLIPGFLPLTYSWTVGSRMPL